MPVNCAVITGRAGWMVRDIEVIDSELRSSRRYSGLKNESSARHPCGGNHKIHT